MLGSFRMVVRTLILFPASTLLTIIRLYGRLVDLRHGRTSDYQRRNQFDG